MKKPDIGSLLFFIISILGIAISIALKKQELGQKTLLGNAFCSGESEKRDCDSVLTSKGAYIYKGFKLSDLSLVYFSGLTISTFLLSFSDFSFINPICHSCFGSSCDFIFCILSGYCSKKMVLPMPKCCWCSFGSKCYRLGLIWKRYMDSRLFPLQIVLL